MQPPGDRPRARQALAVGAAAGLLLAGASIHHQRGSAAVPAGAAAVVNGEPIATAELERALTAVAADRRDGLDPRLVLDRLIDEELLVQRARELGLERLDRDVRGRIVAAMIDTILAAAEMEDPSADELRAFYRENAAFFASGERLHVRDVRVSPEAGRDPGALAAAAGRRLRSGEPFASVVVDVGDSRIAALPDRPLPPAELAELLGPTLADRALALAAGEVSEPIATADGHHVLQLVSRTRGEPPSLSEIEEAARGELRRRRGERAVRTYLEELRAAADVRVRE